MCDLMIHYAGKAFVINTQESIKSKDQINLINRICVHAHQHGWRKLLDSASANVSHASMTKF